MNQSDRQNQLLQLLSSPRGKQLLQLLTKDGGKAMRSAGEALRRGDEASARSIMGPLVEDPAVQALLRAAERDLNHG